MALICPISLLLAPLFIFLSGSTSLCSSALLPPHLASEALLLVSLASSLPVSPAILSSTQIYPLSQPFLNIWTLHWWGGSYSTPFLHPQPCLLLSYVRDSATLVPIIGTLASLLRRHFCVLPTWWMLVCPWVA